VEVSEATITDSFTAVTNRGAITTAMANTPAKKGAAAVEPTEDQHPIVQLIMSSDLYEQEADAFTMAARLLLAESPEDLLNVNEEGDVTHAEDVLGKPFMLHGVKFNPSTVEGGNQDFPLYAILDVSFNGEKDVMSCGGLNVCVAAYTLATKGWLPRMVKITQREKATRAGFHPLNLVSVEDTKDGAGEPF
jgi:hypothetical protein